MKRICTIIACILIAFSLFGCNNKVPPSSNPNISASGDKTKESNTQGQENKVIKVGWEFNTYTRTDNYDAPNTEVYLIIDGENKERLKIGEYIGNFTEDFSWEVPDGSIIQCFGWYAGAGDILSVVREKEDTLAVKHKMLEEGLSEKERKSVQFRVVKTISIPKEVKIEKIKVIKESETQNSN